MVVALALLQLAPAAPFLDTLTADCWNKLRGVIWGRGARVKGGGGEVYLCVREGVCATALALLQLAPAAPFLDTPTAECLNKATGGWGKKKSCASVACVHWGGGMGGGGEGAYRGCPAHRHWLRLPVCELHQEHASFNYTSSLIRAGEPGVNCCCWATCIPPYSFCAPPPSLC